MGAFFDEISDPRHSFIYLFVMDASQRSLLGPSEYAQEAQAELRASQWMRCHQDKVRRSETSGMAPAPDLGEPSASLEESRVNAEYARISFAAEIGCR